MKICLKCRRQLFDTDTSCDKCKSTVIMDKVQFDTLYNQYKASTDKQQEQLRLSPAYKEFCEYVFPAVKKPTSEEREKQRKITKEKEQLKRKQEQEYVEKHIKHIEPKQEKPKQNIPHCPTCGSTNVKPLSTTSKVLGVLTVGLASKQIGKSYMCKDCKYYW